MGLGVALGLGLMGGLVIVLRSEGVGFGFGFVVDATMSFRWEQILVAFILEIFFSVGIAWGESQSTLQRWLRFQPAKRLKGDRTVWAMMTARCWVLMWSER